MGRLTILSTAAFALLLIGIVGVSGARATDEPPVFDPAAVETFEGAILEVSRADLGGQSGLHLLVRDDAGRSREVRVGPSWYLDEQAIELAVGDRVQIAAAPVRMDEVPVYVAASIRRGETEWTLRDETGQPAWARAAAGTSTEPDGMGRQGMGRGMMYGQGMIHGQGRGMMRQGQGMMRGQGQGMMRGRSQGGGCMMHARGADQAGQGQGQGQGRMNRAQSDKPAVSGQAAEGEAQSSSGCGCGMRQRAPRGSGR